MKIWTKHKKASVNRNKLTINAKNGYILIPKSLQSEASYMVGYDKEAIYLIPVAGSESVNQLDAYCVTRGKISPKTFLRESEVATGRYEFERMPDSAIKIHCKIKEPTEA